MNDARRPELLQHFSEEAREHAAAVSKALFSLETSPGDQAMIADILRRTHSLKGTAKVVGAVSVENLANAIETIVGEVKAGRLALGQKVMDTLLEALDAVKAAVEAELTDLLRREAEPSGTILLSHIREAVSIAAGETNYTMTAPAADVTHTTAQMATMGTITWA